MAKYWYLVLLAFVTVLSCKKETKGINTPPQVDTTDTAVVITPPVDPPVANTIGFFLNDWQPKSFTTPDFKDTTIPSSATYTVTVDASSIITKVPRGNAGANANIWMSQIITEAPLMNALTNLHPHIIRFPGGRISDIFSRNASKDAPPADAPTQFVNADGTK